MDDSVENDAPPSEAALSCLSRLLFLLDIRRDKKRHWVQCDWDTENHCVFIYLSNGHSFERVKTDEILPITIRRHRDQEDMFEISDKKPLPWEYVAQSAVLRVVGAELAGMRYDDFIRTDGLFE